MFLASALEKPQAHPLISYKTKLWCETSECINKKMFDFYFDFNFTLINISSKHSSITLLNNRLGEITQYTIHI